MDRDRDEKFVTVGFAVVAVLFAVSCIAQAMLKNTEAAVLEGFIALVFFGLIFAWRWFNRRGETKST